MDLIVSKAIQIARQKQGDRVVPIDLRVSPLGRWKGEFVIEPAPLVDIDLSGPIESSSEPKSSY